MSIWHTINNTYEQDFVLFIDAWLTDSTNEEGKVIAKIDVNTKEVTYNDKRAITDEYAQQAISEAIKKLTEDQRTS